MNTQKTFIQDRKATDSKPEEYGDRYVLTRIEENGDIENLAYSDDKEELMELLKKRLDLNRGEE